MVTNGIYRTMRHPMDSSLMMEWGIYFKQPLGAGIILVITATIFLVATAREDEAE